MGQGDVTFLTWLFFRFRLGINITTSYQGIKVSSLLIRSTTVVRQRFYVFKLIYWNQSIINNTSFSCCWTYTSLRHRRSSDLVTQTAIQVCYKRESACVVSVLSYGSSVQIDGNTSLVRPLRFGVHIYLIHGPTGWPNTMALYGIPSICWWYSAVMITLMLPLPFPGLKAALTGTKYWQNGTSHSLL